MKTFFCLLLISSVFVFQPAHAEVSIRQTLILTPEEQQNLAITIQNNAAAKKLWLAIRQEADAVLRDTPDPLAVIHYEGLLDTNPKRVRTEQSLKDMDKLGSLLFAYYGSQDGKYARKAKQYVLAWVKLYQATGNPINENKFEPLIHCYYVMRSFFNDPEKKEVNKWLHKIAKAEIANTHIPMNNWEAKRIKLVSLIGLTLRNETFIEFASRHFKSYVEVALNGDGTTKDLHQRDALGYHVSGLKPLMVYGITLQQCRQHPGLNPFTYQNSQGGSIQKSVNYVTAYALGEKVHEEWVHTKVALDKKRAEAGLEKYQPGKHFKPEEALEMYELAFYYDDTYREIIERIADGRGRFYHSWFFLLIAQAV